MKELNFKMSFLAVLLCLSFYSLFGQSYRFIPDSNAYWNTTFYVWGSPYHWSPYGVVGDTIIGAYSYFQIRESLNDTVWESENSTYLCAVRQLEDKWLFMFENDTTEYLLYDFDVSVGDLLDIENPNSGQYSMTQVFEIDSIYLNNEWRRRIGVGPEMGGFIMEHWIEGIGSTQGLFTNLLQEVDAGTALTCFTENETLIYLNPIASSCFYQGVNVNDVETRNGPLVFPNPSKDQCVVIPRDRMKMISEIQLYDMHGSYMDFFIELTSNQAALDLSLVPDGMYLLKVHYSDDSTEIEKIVKYSED